MKGNFCNTFYENILHVSYSIYPCALEYMPTLKKILLWYPVFVPQMLGGFDPVCPEAAKVSEQAP